MNQCEGTVISVSYGTQKYGTKLNKEEANIREQVERSVAEAGRQVCARPGKCIVTCGHRRANQGKGERCDRFDWSGVQLPN